MKHPFALFVAVAATATTLLGSTAAPTATAASSRTVASGTLWKTVSLEDSFYSSTLKRCVRVFFGAQAAASWSQIQIDPSYANGWTTETVYKLYKPRLVNPRLRALTYNKCALSGRKAAKVTAMKLTHKYYTTTCKENFSVSISGKWLIPSVGASVVCGQTTLAKYSHKFSKKAAEYELATDGTTLTWPTVASTGNDKNRKVCIQPEASFQAEVGTAAVPHGLDYGKICFTYPK